MDKKKKLVGLIHEALLRSDYSCEICIKMGYKCRVIIPENPPKDFIPNWSDCDFKANIYKTLTTEHI